MQRAFYRYFGILLIPFVYAVIYFLITSEGGLLEDPSSYYQKYTIANIDLMKSIDDLLTILHTGDIETTSISFSGLNIAAFIYFGTLSLLPFNVFVFMNIYILSIGTFALMRKISNLTLGSIFLILLSFPMIINLHFTWRQFAAQILVLYFAASSYKYKRFSFLMCTLFIHPSALISIPEKYVLLSHYKSLQRIFLIIVSCLIGYAIALYSTISFKIVNHDPLEFQKNMLWILMLLLYFYPLLVKGPMQFSNMSLFLPMLLVYLAFSSSLVGISRIVTLGIFSAMVTSLHESPKYSRYYSIIGPVSLMLYLLFIRQ